MLSFYFCNTGHIPYQIRRKNKDYPYGIIHGSVQSAPSELGLIPFWGLVGVGWYALALAQRRPPPLKRRRDPESDWICRTNIDVSMSADFEGYVVKVLLAPKWVRGRGKKIRGNKTLKESMISLSSSEKVCWLSIYRHVQGGRWGGEGLLPLPGFLNLISYIFLLSNDFEKMIKFIIH